ASPDIMIATAAERTPKLGTEVISDLYHNPLWVAERIVLLDHLTRGRAMLGLGPGSLPLRRAIVHAQKNNPQGLAQVRHHATGAVKPSWRRPRLTCIACHGLPPAVVRERRFNLSAAPCNDRCARLGNHRPRDLGALARRRMLGVGVLHDH